MAALFAPLGSLPRIGPALAKRLASATGGPLVRDLLLHLPERYVQRQAIHHPREAPAEAEVLLPAVVESLRAGRSRAGRPYVEVRCSAAGAPLLVRMMNGRLAWLSGLLPLASTRWFAGVVRPEGEAFSMVSPAIGANPLPLIEPVWPLVAGLTQGVVARAMTAALARLPTLPEWQDPPLRRREGWAGFADALRALQAPTVLPEALPRLRLAYDELLAGQLALGLVRRRVRGRPGRALHGDGRLRVPALAAFGHAPTPSQQVALAEIDADLAAPVRMLRLLQGDVGAGKTLVAILAMLRAVEAGTQAALMAPTELLARQHARTLEKLAGAAGVPWVLLTGSLQAKQRRLALAGIADGSVRLVVGTHALFQKGVEFADLGLAVVDEQHRFGVAQRLALAAKGSCDVLAMTATPIPRTLLLTRWGEMAVSRLTGKPAGRQPIATRIVGQERLPEIVARLAEAMARGERAYWVVRAIAENERDDSVAAEARFAELAARFPGQVGLAHGMLDIALREAALADFAAGRTQLLIATTVVEVGVDVPDATIMLVEQAERFGLSALHQLRGRVGRGSKPSSCLLIHSEGLPGAAIKRLMVLRDTEDGFAIAEQDFLFRGGGDLIGTRQAGHAGARLAAEDTPPESLARLLEIAHDDAEVLLERDPALASRRGAAARLLLRLFEHDASLAPLDAG